MISFRATPVLAVAFALWLLWRLWLVRRDGAPDPLREALVALLLAWALAVGSVTFFPMTIVFYDWHARFSLVPFASILQLLAETPPQVALRNIAGNLVLLAPVGAALPLLFERLRPLRATTARVAVISVAIELLQLLTRARAVDVDDVLLNTVGGVAGWAVAVALLRLLERRPDGRRVVARLRGSAGTGSDSRRVPHEPLRPAAGLLAATLVLTVPWMATSLIGGTLGAGPDGIEGVAVEGMQEARVVARADVAEHTLLVAQDAASVRLAGFERVLPGRWTPQVTSNLLPTDRSSWSYGITAYNPSAGEVPTFYVWGVNRSEATRLHVLGNGLDELLDVPAGPFALGVLLDDPTALQAGRLEEFTLRFATADGRDVSDELDAAAA